MTLETVKSLRSKFESDEALKEFIEFGMAPDSIKGEEAKQSEEDDASVKLFMDIFTKKEKKVVAKPDFRSFLKQKKAVGATIVKSQDLIVVQEK
jgi:hypothetical protein